MTSEENDASDELKWNYSDNALNVWEADEGLKRRVQTSRKLGVFLDYDGTLTPIVSDPEKSFISERMRNLIAKLSGQKDTNVAIVSGRCISKLQQFLNLTNLHLSGSHGAEILCPATICNPKGAEMRVAQNLDELRAAQQEVHQKLLEAYPGCQIEDNKFVFSIHFRNAEFQLLPRRQKRAKVRDLERDMRVIAKKRNLRMDYGKKVFEIKPKGTWDKGFAVLWLIRQVMWRDHIIEGNPYGEDTLSYDDREEDSSEGPEVNEEDAEEQVVKNDPPFYFYLGDDQSDESAFAILKKNYPDRSLGILVSAKPRETAATYWLKDVNEVYEFLSLLLRDPESVDTLTSSSDQKDEGSTSTHIVKPPNSSTIRSQLGDIQTQPRVAPEKEQQGT